MTIYYKFKKVILLPVIRFPEVECFFLLKESVVDT